MTPTPPAFESIESVQQHLSTQSYIADQALSTVLYLSWHMQKAVFLEGEPGVGKTEVALVLARMLSTRLIRLQCYEGLDASHALYEWNYSKQLLRIRMDEQCRISPDEMGATIYSEPYLIKRPLLEAIRGAQNQSPVLLIDELDRADEEFEAFLLEILDRFQVTIPELGTLKAVHKPVVVVTSNRTRDVHDALKRRCLYHWIDHPDFEKELLIVKARLPGIDATLSDQVVRFMQTLRQHDFIKRPGVSETLDWAEALLRLNAATLDAAMVEHTLGCILKHREDIRRFQEDIWPDRMQRLSLLDPQSHGLG